MVPKLEHEVVRAFRGISPHPETYTQFRECHSLCKVIAEGDFVQKVHHQPFGRHLQPKVGRPTLHILAVDDEPLIADLIQSLFPDDHVEAFVRARSAVERACAVSFDLIFCDQSMPDLTGIEVFTELAHAYRDRDLTQRFVLMTGFAFSPDLRIFLARYPVDLLRKPFRAAALEQFAQRAAGLSPVMG